MNYKQALIKRNVESILLWPITFIGKIVGHFYSLKSKHDIFLFFPNADVGGSIKVNADIAILLKDKNPLIIFSKKPTNNDFKALFEIEGVTLLDLHKYIDIKAFHFINVLYRGILSTWINKVENPVVFGGECIYFYKLLPLLNKKVKTIELCHVNNWLNFSQAYVNLIDKRVFSTKKIKRDVEAQYIVNKIPAHFTQNLLFIDNKIDIPPYFENVHDKLEILFVGRAAAQKRVHLIAAIADKLKDTNKKIHFSFVGAVQEYINEKKLTNCTCYGTIKDKEMLNKLYLNADVLILTSSYEGLPIVVMEMMARGKVVLSTAVDGIPDYIKHEETGLLIYETDEDKIIEKGILLLQKLDTDRRQLKVMGQNSYVLAGSHFSADNFDSFYIKLFTDNN